MKLHVGVTEQDINWGSPNNCETCPVARAIERAVGDPSIRVSVGLHTIRLRKWFHTTHSALLPGSHPVAVFVQKFDKGEPVEPFSFDVNLVEHI